MLEPYRPVLTPLPAARFDSASAQARLCDYYKVASLDAYGSFDRALVAACGALLEYVELTQVGKLPALQPPSIRDPGHTVLIDAATRANLELAQTLVRQPEGQPAGHCGLYGHWRRKPAAGRLAGRAAHRYRSHLIPARCGRGLYRRSRAGSGG
jgi:hypothetical protein